MGSEADLVKSRFARGCRCFAVMIGGAVAGFGWLSTGPEWIGELQLEITPGEGEGYVWNCATLEAHRRKGIFRSLLIGISEHARQSGLKRLWIGSLAIPAEKAVAPSGFRPALRLHSVTVAGVHFTWVRAVEDPGLSAAAVEALRTQSYFLVRPVRRRRH